MSELLRILIVDDHPIVKKGLYFLLTAKRGMEIVGDADNGDDAVLMAHRLKPDIILMDLIMPKKNGLEATREIIAKDPETKILILTSFVEEE
ncbi:MAG: response regulator transcription factor [Anaerolineaceae bacterium]|nr:response regulator transcription factor [Anaerolineaceae bacterium]